MAHFYGSLRGRTGEATRLGTRQSGLQVKAASWEGAVSVQLFDNHGTDWAFIQLVPHHGTGTTLTLYSGPVSGPPKVRKVGDLTDNEWRSISQVRIGS